MAKVRVTIAVTLEVDKEGWLRDYGVSEGLREDVKAFAHSLVSEGNENWKVVSFK